MRPAQAETVWPAEELSILVEGSPLGAIEWTADRRIARWSPRAQTIFGWSAEEVTGKRAEELGPGPELEWSAIAEELGAVAAGETALGRNLHRTQRKDGEPVWCEWFHGLRPDPAGRTPSIVSLVLDVSTQMQAEEERERLVRQLAAEVHRGELQAGASEARARELEAVFESTHAQLALLDRRLCFTRVNSAYARGCGHPKSALLGRAHFELFPDADNERIFSAVRDGGQPHHVTEKVFTFADQPQRGPTWWNWSLVPIKDGQCEVQALLLSLVEVTEQVVARQRLQRMAEDARREAQVRERFLAVLGHDLRQPMNVLATSLGALQRRGPRDEREQRTLERMDRAVRRMDGMVGALIDYSRCTSGKGLALDRTRLELGALCEEVLADARATYTERALQLEASGDLSGSWDRERLLQAIGNLLGNALRYGDPSEPVRLRASGEGDRVTVEVHNRGAPISAEALEAIFQPFGRAKDGENVGANEGLGLGLYLVREIARAHGGTADARSSAEEGTVIRIELPRGT